MNLEGRRESSNVEDRRSKRVKQVVGGGVSISSLIIIALVTLLSGGSGTDVFTNVVNQALQGGGTTTTTTSEYQPTEEEQELEKFCKQILASTEDIWSAKFKKLNKTYIPPKLVFYKDQTQTGCGTGSASSGPFYCSADQCVYLDISFLETMKQTLGAEGDFANAYVIAHEVGHHVQYLLGTLEQAHNQMARVNNTQSNKISVRIELQADFYAGVWGHDENSTFHSLDDGDMQEAINTAHQIGDDYLTQGKVSPENFNHGTSAQRMKWLKKGLTTGDMSQGDTFSVSESEL